MTLDSIEDVECDHRQEEQASGLQRNFWPSVSTITRTMLDEQDSQTKMRFFGERRDLTTGDLLTFYTYHSILVLFYLLFSVYRLFERFINNTKLRFLNIAYNTNSDPSVINSDVNKLQKIPHKIASILTFKSEQEENGGIGGLCNDTSSLVIWCLASGIPYLQVYEHDGNLKKSIPQLRESIVETLVSNFGTDSIPKFLIKIPHLNLKFEGAYDGEYGNGYTGGYDIEISLLSYVDGRPTIVELTKVLGELCQRGELKVEDITIDFIDKELKELVGDEPDLIVSFQPSLDLNGFPPWHIRLSEMYWEPDNERVSYAVFLRALQKYSTSKVNVGR